jgi:nucleotide-binding universal stress UspA family protein
MLSFKPLSRRIMNGNMYRQCRPPKPGNVFGGQSDPDHATAVERATWESRANFHPRRILVGMDFSEASESARRFAVAIAVASDALIDLVHVFDVFTEAFICDNAEVLERAESIMSDIDRALVRRERLALAQGVRAVHTRLVGAPGIEIAIHAARTGTDLIVLGDGHEQLGPYGWTWGRRAAEQIAHSPRWRGVILLRSGRRTVA